MPEEKKKTKYVPLSMDAQMSRRYAGEPIFYDMQIKFAADGGLSSLDDFMAAMGAAEQLTLKDAVELALEQTVPFIPDETMLAKYGEALQKGYTRNGTVLRNVRFKCYGWLRAVAPEEPEKSEEPAGDGGTKKED